MTLYIAVCSSLLLILNNHGIAITPGDVSTAFHNNFSGDNFNNHYKIWIVCHYYYFGERYYWIFCPILEKEGVNSYYSCFNTLNL